MFFKFKQNNSGGVFDIDTFMGVAECVIIEASNVDEACDKAESIGIYFDGVNEGRDCRCCGNRWSIPYTGYEVPTYYGEAITDSSIFRRVTNANQNNRGRIVVHYADGNVHWYRETRYTSSCKEVYPKGD